jgi:type VI protein secretion system component Hcp
MLDKTNVSTPGDKRTKAVELRYRNIWYRHCVFRRAGALSYRLAMTHLSHMLEHNP